MQKSTRAALAVCLGLVGVAGIVVPSIGQDREVRQAKDGGQTAAVPKNAGPAVIGTINMEAVFKACDKFLAIEEQIETDAKVRQGELMKIANEGNAETEKLKKLAQGTSTTKGIEDNITSLQARFEAGRKQAQMEIARKQGELMANTVNEVNQMAEAVAKQRGITLVLKASSTPAAMSQPDTIEMALSRAVVYADPRFDITADVIKWLNYFNEQNKGPKPTKNHNPAAPGAAAPAPAAAVAPAGDARIR
jgi:Skp family chaperone for outer membrane proteins